MNQPANTPPNLPKKDSTVLTLTEKSYWAPFLTLGHIDQAPLDCGFYTIEPILAAQLLQTRNPKNRTLKEVKIGQLVTDIKTGNFRLNGETIIFSDEGNLLNGQHRLSAVVITGRPITTVVVFGIPGDAVATMDQGKTRAVGDILHMETDTPNGNTFAAILRGFIGYKSGDGTSFGRPSHITRAEILKAAQDNPQLGEITRWATRFKSDVKGVTTCSHLGIARAILEPVYGGEVVCFLEHVARGDGLSIDSPGFAVRRRLTSNAGRMGIASAIECMMRGAIAHMEGRRLSRIQMDGRLPLLKKAQGRFPT